MEIKNYDLKITINGKEYEFYLNNKTHQWHILIDGEYISYTKAKGQAIIDFLNRLPQ